MPTPANQIEALDCPLYNNWVSFRLVNEHAQGAPYAGLSYQLHDREGQIYTGTLDNDGFARVDNLFCGVLILGLATLSSGASGSWYEDLVIRPDFKIPLTALQIAAEQSPFGPRNPDGQTYLAEERAATEGAKFLRVEVSDFVEARAHLPDPDTQRQPRPSQGLRQSDGEDPQQPGIALAPNQHHVLEVKALRAYSPLLSRDTSFCALNAYQLAVLSACAYAPFSEEKPFGKEYQSLPPPYSLHGSIGHVLRESLACGIKPTQFEPIKPKQTEPAERHHLLYEEVPYSKRLEVMPYDPARYRAEAARGWRNPEDVHFLFHEETHTQGFITHNDKLVLISLRGTEFKFPFSDLFQDLDARQVPYKGYNEQDTHKAQAHRGFHDAFLAAKEFVDRYLRAFHRPEMSIIVCGHSLGGAIALLLGEWLRHNWSKDVQLYTFGAPRAGDQAFVQGARDLIHHRLVNHNDPIPSVPSAWMDVEWKLALPATIVLLTSASTAAIPLLIAGLVNLRDDPFEHHGEQWHFLPRQEGASLLWQPGCEALSEQSCARYVNEIALKGDMPRRAAFLSQLFKAKQHFISTAYSRAALTNLLRWNASLARQGSLFTEEEAARYGEEVEQLEQKMAGWKPATYQQFRAATRVRFEPRFYNKSPIELRAMYERGEAVIRTVSIGQRKRLLELRRQLAQAQRPISAHQVFGEFADREDLAALLDEWRTKAEIQKAERIAYTRTAARPLTTA
ncbi:MAG TPA: lipase family protein [Pseudomonas sp.]|nr:lipase family protein [Pseudomonas sp.]